MPYGTVNADVIQSSVANTSLGAGNASIMKNRIINGAMVIDQRNAGASISTPTSGAWTYFLDRWAYFCTSTAKFSVQQNAGSVTPPVGFVNYLGATSLAATTVGATDVYDIKQSVEGFNIADLGWGTANAKTITISFWVRSSLTGTFGGSLSNGGFDRFYPFSYTISAANTWEQKTITVAGDTSGTWLTTNGIGLNLVFGLGVGSTYLGTAGSWGSTAYLSATGSTNVVATSGATFYITGVQLEVGSSATGFEYRIYGTELANCQRYFQNYYGIYFSTYNTNGEYAGATVTLPVAMRTAPTFTKLGTWSVVNCNQPVVTTADSNTVNSFNCYALWTANARGYYAGDSSTRYVTCSAEL